MNSEEPSNGRTTFILDTELEIANKKLKISNETDEQFWAIQYSFDQDQ
jgi:hypothetical protein